MHISEAPKVRHACNLTKSRYPVVSALTVARLFRFATSDDYSGYDDCNGAAARCFYPARWE
jgi:hypothetical protein